MYILAKHWSSLASEELSVNLHMVWLPPSGSRESHVILFSVLWTFIDILFRIKRRKWHDSEHIFFKLH